MYYLVKLQELNVKHEVGKIFVLFGVLRVNFLKKANYFLPYHVKYLKENMPKNLSIFIKQNFFPKSVHVFLLINLQTRALIHNPYTVHLMWC